MVELAEFTGVQTVFFTVLRNCKKRHLKELKQALCFLTFMLQKPLQRASLARGLKKRESQPNAVFEIPDPAEKTQKTPHATAVTLDLIHLISLTSSLTADGCKTVKCLLDILQLPNGLTQMQRSIKQALEVFFFLRPLFRLKLPDTLRASMFLLNLLDSCWLPEHNSIVQADIL